jgi:hypothetical protein
MGHLQSQTIIKGGGLQANPMDNAFARKLLLAHANWGKFQSL